MDREFRITPSSCVAATLWVACVALLALGEWTRVIDLGFWSVLCCVGAATSTIHVFVVRLGQERKAIFELGRSLADKDVTRLPRT